MGTEPPVEAHTHARRTFERHHLRRQNVGKLARAATEGERAEPAHGAGMAVGTAWVAPGSTMPTSGATTWQMPCSGSSISNSLMPLRRLPSRIALRKAAPDGL